MDHRDGVYELACDLPMLSEADFLFPALRRAATIKGSEPLMGIR